MPMRPWLVIGVSRAGRRLRRRLGGRAVAHLPAVAQRGATSATKDPYFNKDIGFYVFDLPWLHFLVDFADGGRGGRAASPRRSSTTSSAGSGCSPAATGSPEPRRRSCRCCSGVFVLAKGADYWLDRFDLLTHQGERFTGMNYTDDNAVLPAKNILMGIALICALLFFVNVWRRTWLLPAVGLALLVLSAILLGLIWPGIVQQFQVKPSEADKEAPYIAAEHRRDPRRPTTSTTSWRRATRASRRSATRSSPATSSTTRASGWSTRGWCSSCSSRSSRSAATTPSPPILDVDRYEIDGARARRRPRRPRARPGRPARQQQELVQPAHRLHPRLRRDRRLRQPAPGRQRQAGRPAPTRAVGREGHPADR